jgi:hypothetical protein
MDSRELNRENWVDCTRTLAQVIGMTGRYR